MSRLSRGEQEFVSGDGKPRPSGDPTITAPITPAALTGGQEIDARGVPAPLPLLRAHRALRTMRAGEELRVVVSDEASLAEFQALAKYVTSIELVAQHAEREAFVHVLRKRR